MLGGDVCNGCYRSMRFVVQDGGGGGIRGFPAECEHRSSRDLLGLRAEEHLRGQGISTLIRFDWVGSRSFRAPPLGAAP